MNEDVHQTLGRVEGKLDSLIESFGAYRSTHEKEHDTVDRHVSDLQADVNQAKGAKWAVMALAGLISAAVTAADKFFTR